ncbi:G-protein coupled bile acid receptor 1 isoform X1 [Myotis lucifugus]|uniref:G-protein coupled bile acid receptor 1 isoform X1 n=1 Tax=Myotis lucifugus TaxID=59463 RepID=UPI0006D73A79|nr:G-protein coupled bile acid receptor 1 isoform X1 [Myotis lucifugus]
MLSHNIFHNNPKSSFLSSPFYRWENWSPEFHPSRTQAGAEPAAATSLGPCYPRVEAPCSPRPGHQTSPEALQGRLQQFPDTGQPRLRSTCLQLPSPNFSFLSLLANLLLVHGERYMAVLRPLRAPGSTRLALLLTWAGPLLFTSLPALGWNHWAPSANCSSQAVFPAPYLYLEVYGLLLPAVGAAALLSARVLITAHRQLQDIRRQERAVCRGVPSALARALTWRQARAQAGATLLFGLCWGPYVATLLLSVLAYEQRPPLGPGTLLSLVSLGSASAAAVPVAMGLSDQRYTAPWRAAARRWRRVLRGRASRSSPGPGTAYRTSSQSSTDLDLN